MSYSIAELLELLRREGGERLQIHVGLAPVLIIKREDYEVEGPIITAQKGDAAWTHRRRSSAALPSKSSVTAIEVAQISPLKFVPGDPRFGLWNSPRTLSRL